MRRLPLLVPFLLALHGCGGKTAPSVQDDGRGTATVKIAWPAPTVGRVIPLSAAAVLVELKNAAGTVKARFTIVRPDAAGTSLKVKAGTYTLVATSYPNSNATGTAQATGTGTVTIVANATTPADVTMGSTVTSLAISPTSLTPTVGDAVTLAASAKNGSAIVLVDPSTVHWASSDPTVASVDATGLTPTLKAVKAGVATISAQFTEVEPTLNQSPVSGTASVAVTVSNPPATLADSGWAKFRGDAQNSGRGTGSLSLTATPSRLADLSTTVGNTTQTVIGKDGSLYVSTLDGNVAKVNPAGGVAWTALIDANNDTLPTLAATSDGNLLCLTTTGKLVSIDADTGATTVRYDAGSESSPLEQFYGKLTVDGSGTAYFGSNDGKVYSVAPSGKVLSTSIGAAAPPLPLALSADGKLLFVNSGGFGGSLYGIETTTMKPKWPSPVSLGGAINGNPAVAPNGDVVTIVSGLKVYGLRPANGSVDWQVAAPSNSAGTVLFQRRPAISGDGTVYVTATLVGGGFSSSALIYAIDPVTHLVSHTGSVATNSGATVTSPVIGSNGSVYFAVDGTVYAFGSALGNSTASYQVAPSLTSDDLVLANGALYTTANALSGNAGLYKVQ